MRIFLELHLCAFFFFQAHLWHLSGSLAWKFGLRYNLHLCFSSSFLPSLYFHISCQHTLQLCLACQCQAAVPFSINLLICVWFNFLPAGQVSSKPNTGHIWNSKNIAQNPASKPTCLQIDNAVLKLQWMKKVTMQSPPNWWDKLAATFIADLLEDVPQLKVWFSSAHRGGGVVYGAENHRWFWSDLLLFKEMTLDLVLAPERKVFTFEIHKRKPI